MGRSVTSLGIALVAAAAGLFAATQAGCGADEPESAAVPASTASVNVATPQARRPARPRPYTVPVDALVVSSSPDLAAALSNGHREAIVLAPGVYDNPRPFVDRDGDRLYAALPGRAVLKAGVVLGANAGPPGASIRGLTFNVRDRAKTLHGAIVHVWGSASHASILDTRLYGHGRVETALLVRQPLGFVARRIVAEGFRSYGVLVDPNNLHYRTRAPFALSDLTISRVRRPLRGSSNGRAEACLWLGSPGTAKRDRDPRLARRRRDDQPVAGRDLHRALHHRHDLQPPAHRAPRQPGRERGMVEPRRRAKAREQRQRDRERRSPDDARRRLPRRGDHAHGCPPERVRRSGLGRDRRLPRPGQHLLRQRLRRDRPDGSRGHARPRHREDRRVKGSVVVTDAEERAALGACRGLTRAGYRVCAVSRLSPAA